MPNSASIVSISLGLGQPRIFATVNLKDAMIAPEQ
jgi:hypothetical protein